MCLPDAGRSLILVTDKVGDEGRGTRDEEEAEELLMRRGRGGEKERDEGKEKRRSQQRSSSPDLNTRSISASNWSQSE